MNLEDFKNLKNGNKIYKITEYGVIEKEVAIVNEYNYWLKIIFTDGTKISVVSPKGSKIYFKSQDEAEKEFENTKKLKIKKAKLYEYETKLNEELGIDTFIIKY